jgi:hypothetical protein
MIQDQKSADLGGATWSAMSQLAKGVSPVDVKGSIVDKHPEFDIETINKIVTDAENNLIKNDGYLKPPIPPTQNTLSWTADECQKRLRISADSEIIEVKNAKGKLVAKVQIYLNGHEETGILLAKISELEQELAIAKADAEKYSQVKKLLGL